MQKLLKRTAQAERQVARRLARSADQAVRADRRERLTAQRRMRGALYRDLHASRRARAEDWELGALAPRRDIGAAVGPAYGAASEEGRQRGTGRHALPREVLMQRCEWLGGPDDLNLVVGDRVAVVEGPSAGCVGKITSIDPKCAEVQLEGVSQGLYTHDEKIAKALMDPEAPEHSREAVTTTTTAIPLPISAVRLVHPLTDPATGRTRDVIIRHLRHGRVFVDKVTGRREWTRVVPGLGITIPWPNEEDSPTPDPTRNAKEYPGADTLRIDVEERTFVPTLLRPPMPPAVIDELRNRYSVFRTRHDPEYIARKEAEWGAADAARAARNGRGVVVPPEMRTPLMELHLKEKAERKQRPEPVLTEEMLEKIGAVIARSMEEKSKTPPDNNLSEDQEPRPSPPS